MRNHLFYTTLLSINLFITPALYAADKASDQQLKTLSQQYGTSNLSLDEKITRISAEFLGSKYQLGPLGEGADGQFDKQALYRDDVFDCVTYVETVLALSHAKNFAQFRHVLNQLRYQHGQPRFIERHHFMTTDWIPANQKLGYVRDITTQFKNSTGKSMALSVTTEFDKASWFHKRAENMTNKNALLTLTQSIAKQRVTLNYLAISDLLDDNDQIPAEISAQFPTISIVSIVRPNWDLKQKIGTNMNISHLGFVIKKDGQLIFRDASTIHKKVVDTPLADYLARVKNSPTIKGIHVLAVNSDIYKSRITTLSASQQQHMRSKNVYNDNCPIGLERLRNVYFSYYDFNGDVQHDGHIVVQDEVATATSALFADLFTQKFPLSQSVPLEVYDGDDDRSLAANNTAAFNCRTITGSTDKFSQHAYGIAIDINPVQNPYIKGEVILPATGASYLDREQQRAGMVEPVIDIFQKNGFSVWGGNWQSLKDWQHFEWVK